MFISDDVVACDGYFTFLITQENNIFVTGLNPQY